MYNIVQNAKDPIDAVAFRKYIYIYICNAALQADTFVYLYVYVCIKIEYNMTEPSFLPNQY